MISGQIRKRAVIENAETPRDKSLCLKCKYHGWLGAIPKGKIPEDAMRDNLYCERSVYLHESCLKDRGNFRTYDSRGDGPGCELYQPGIPKGDTSSWVGGKLI